MAIPAGYAQLSSGFWTKTSDGSGPYMIDATGAVNYVGQGNTSYGHVRTSDEPTALFSDTFEVLDTTDRWTTKLSTGTASAAGGTLTLASSSTALAYGGLFTKPTFAPKGLNFIFGAMVITFPTAVVAQTARIFGFGIIPATPTVALPLSDGICFYVDGAGAMFVKVYASSVEVSSTAIPLYNPSSGVPMGLAVQYRADGTVFLVNSASNVVASIPINTPNVETMSLVALSVAGAAPGASATMLCKAVGVGDSGKNNQFICDATFPWRGATVDAQGSLNVRLNQKGVRTYSAAGNMVLAAAATDVATLTGNATTTVFVTKVSVSGVQTAAGMNEILLIKRSTADTGGTSTGATAVPHDASDIAANGAVLVYTANPGALGTAIGTLRRNYQSIGTPTSVAGVPLVYDFGAIGKEIALRGAASQLAVNLNGATLAGGALDVVFEWYEV